MPGVRDRYLALTGAGQGIVHVIGPEQGFTLPGTTLVCGDSYGALAFGIGAGECETVLTTQTSWQTRAKTMRVAFLGDIPPDLTAKD